MAREENRGGFDSVPIARLAKGATGKRQEDEAYIPPLVAVSGSEQLLNMIQRLLDILMVKSSALSSTPHWPVFGRREQVGDMRMNPFKIFVFHSPQQPRLAQWLNMSCPCSA